MISTLECNHSYHNLIFCEPKMDKRGVYSTLSMKGSAISVKNMMNALAYFDGSNDLVDICNIVNITIKECQLIVELLLKNNLIKKLP